MTEEIIQVAKRDATGKSASRSLRKQGLIPAVVYGLNEPPVAISISPKIVARIIASETGLNSMIHLQREGTEIKRHAIIKDVQRDPVTGRLSHVDFMRVDPTHKVRVHVPIRLQGTPAGVKEGGLLDFTHREIEVECLPSFIPAHVDVNVEHLQVGDVPAPGPDLPGFPPDRDRRRPQRDLLGQGQAGRGDRSGHRGRRRRRRGPRRRGRPGRRGQGQEVGRARTLEGRAPGPALLRLEVGNPCGPSFPLGNPGDAYTATRHNLGRLMLMRWMQRPRARPPGIAAPAAQRHPLCPDRRPSRPWSRAPG